MKLIYSQYLELQSFAQFGSDLDDDTKFRLAQGRRIVEILKQDRNAPVPVEKQVCIIYAVTHKYLQNVAVELVKEYEKGLYEYLDANADPLLRSIRETGKLEQADEDALNQALTAYTDGFVRAH